MFSFIICFRFRHLEKAYPDQVREISTFFRYHVASIEMERMEMMTDGSLTSHYRHWLIQHFDAQIHQVNTSSVCDPLCILNCCHWRCFCCVWFHLSMFVYTCICVQNSSIFVCNFPGYGSHREEPESSWRKGKAHRQSHEKYCSGSQEETAPIQTFRQVDGELVPCQLTSSLSVCHRVWSSGTVGWYHHRASQEMVWQQTKQKV